MANIYSVASGLASVGSTWSGGVVPGAGDRVLITHDVTLDGTYTWGDDSTSSIVINSITTTNSITIYGAGKLIASRTVNSQLTCNGNLMLAGSSGVSGTYDAGTTASPIPLGIAHALILNKSAVITAGRYGFDTEQNGAKQSKATFHGYYRSRNALLVAGIAVGSTQAQVTGAVNWRVGDQVALAPTTSFSALDVVTLTSVTDLGGGVTQIGFAATTFAHAGLSPVGNFTSNVIVTSFDRTKPGYMALCCYGSTSYPNAIHLENTRFDGYGNCAADLSRKPALPVISFNGQSGSPNVVDEVKSCVWFASDIPAANSNGFIVYNYGQRLAGSDLAVCQQSQLNAALTLRQGAQIDFQNFTSYRCYLYLQSFYSQGGVGVNITGGGVFGTSMTSLLFDSGAKHTYENLVFGPTNDSRYLRGTAIFEAVFRNCDFGNNFGVGSALRVFDGLASSGAGYSFTLDNCTIHPSLSGTTAAAQNIAGSYVSIVDKNSDLTAQEHHTPPGSFYRDNSVTQRSVSSLRLNTDPAASYAATRQVSIPANNSETKRVVGYLRKNASYGSATRPSVTISGLGITPVVFTMPDTSDSWEKFDISATNSSGLNGSFKLTFAAQSANSGAQCWLDGIYDAPFVMVYRHYGFVFDSGRVARTVDAASALSESAALALSGLSVNHGTQTLTISGSRTLSEIYDWVHAHLCQTANLSQPEFFTATGGGNYTCTYNVELTGAITGAGALSMSSKTLTASGTSSVSISHSAGTFTAISVTGYTVGARLQVYNVTTATELYNDIPASGTLNLNVQHTANQTIRLRMARVVGLDADELIETTGLLTASGAPFLLTPHPDAVYEANGIDGDTVTEFTADYPNVQIDINDPDGVTTPQRGYAWYMSGQMTAAGIAAFHGGMVADDQTNYMIQTSILDMRVQNVSAVPCVIAGGRLYREDGTSIFAAGVGPIQADPGKAYVASGASAATVASAVRTELATELGRLDVAVGTRLAGASYTAPDNASVTAIKAKTDNLPADPASNTQVNTRLAAAGYTAPPAASVVATAVRGELATELGRVDAAVSTRLAGAAYVAPDNAGIAAIPTNPLLTTDARLNHLDADVSSRLPTAGYTAPDNTGISSLAAKLPSGGAKMAGEGVTAKNLDQIAVDVSGLATAAQVAAVPAGVRTEIGTELGRIDANVSSRLAGGSYTAPLDASATQAAAAAALIAYDPATGAEVAALPTAAQIATAVMNEVV